MTIVTSGFSNKSLLLFPRNSFEQSWTCVLESKTLLQNSQNKFVFFLSVRFWPYRTFPLSVNWMNLFSFCLLLTLSIFFLLLASQVVQKRKLNALIWPPINFVVKFNKHLSMKNLFVSIIATENNKQYLVYFYKHIAFLRVFFYKRTCMLHCSSYMFN